MNLQEYYSSRKEMVDKAVKEFLEREELLDISPTTLGGKRLRGALAILVCEALGGKPEDALDGAIAVELAHAASLDADDIVDLDVIRRGKPSTWVLRGIVRTVVGTHALVSAALNLVKKYGFEAIEVFTDTYMKMVRGEVKDIVGGGFYEAIVGAKTASLWAASSGVGALAAGRRDYLKLAMNYGHSVGMAFQIADDIVDVTKLIESGKILDIIRSPSAMAFITYIGLESMLKLPPFEVLRRGLGYLEEQMKIVAVEKLNQWVKTAESYASQFPESPFKQLLVEYPTFAVDMMFEEAGWKK